LDDVCKTAIFYAEKMCAKATYSQTLDGEEPEQVGNIEIRLE
jgi:hypothetical protein